MKRYFLITAIIISFIFSNCTKSRIYEKHTTLENHTWKRIGGNNVIKFEVPVDDTTHSFDIKLVIIYNNKFQYEVLRIGFSVKTPDGEDKYSMHNLDIKESNDSYKGIKEKDREEWKLTEFLAREYHFNKKGKYVFEVENQMSKFEMQGIMNIGLIIDRADSD